MSLCCIYLVVSKINRIFAAQTFNFLKRMENQEEKKIGLIGKILGKRNEPEFSAEREWIE